MVKHPLDLGVGVGLRAPYLSEFTTKNPSITLKKSVQWVEAVTENYLSYPELQIPHTLTKPLQNLLKVRANFPVALHGVSLNLGGTTDDSRYLNLLKDLIQEVEPIYVSDHLCWTRVEGHASHDLLPLPYNQEALSLIVERIQRAQEFLGRQILIENLSSYVTFKQSTMSEQEFVSQVVLRSGCGLLLDINNVYVSAKNHGFNALEYICDLPLDQVAQIHLAGHRTKPDGYLIDTHDEPVCQDVWDLFAQTTSMLGLRSTMIERDDDFPEWSELEIELQKIHHIRKEHLIAKDRTTYHAPDNTRVQEMSHV